MEHSRLQSAFFIAIFGIIAVLNFWIFKNFFGILLISLTLAVLFLPLHKVVLKYIKNENAAALITTVAALIIVMVPLFFLASRLFFEVQGFINSLNDNNNTFVTHLLDRIRGLDSSSVSFNLNQYLRNIASSVLNNVGAI